MNFNLNKGDKYAYWDLSEDDSIWEVVNMDRFGWYVGFKVVRVGDNYVTNKLDMCDPKKIRPATKLEIKLNKRLDYK